MRRIGIVTIPDYNNYGNRLQNYAVKSYFEEHGFQVNTLELNDYEFSKRKGRKYKLLLNRYKLSFVLYLMELLKGGISHAERYARFKRFTDSYLNTLYYPNWDMECLRKIGERFDYIAIGSDQVWHPYVNTTPNLFFGSFVSAEKRLFFSPSFGLDSISDEYSQLVKSRLNGVKNISVREKAGKAILDDLIESNVEVLCDPTLLIEKSKWIKIANRPNDIPDKYVLSYFLGPVNDSYNQVRSDISVKCGTEIYCIAARNEKKGLATGPSEFIYSIMNSQFVVTDSFHAVVFSIIFSKPFIVCSRLKEDGTSAGLDSRIDILLDTFNLKYRKYSENIDISDIFSEVIDATDKLHELRNKVDTYFSKIIGENIEGRKDGE